MCNISNISNNQLKSIYRIYMSRGYKIANYNTSVKKNNYVYPEEDPETVKTS